MLSAAIARELRSFLKDRGVTFAHEDLICYGYDAAVSGPTPDVVAFPEHGDQVAQLVRFASRRGIPVVPRGAGTGCSGGALSARGGILLSFEKMDHILSIDEELRIAIVEPGVITGYFQRAVEERGLFYPPDPSSARICTLGGNVGHGAGGLQGWKYGTTKDYMIGLEAVTAEGHFLRTGYFAPGETYDLTGLVVGSEGTLAIVIKMAIMLLPRPESVCTLLFVFSHVHQALRTAERILEMGLMPAALEFMDQKALDCIRAHGSVDLPSHDGHILLIEFCGVQLQIQAESDCAEEVAQSEGATYTQRAVQLQKRQNIWSLRRALSPSMAHAARRKISLDVCVPLSAVSALLESVEHIASRNRLSIITFGHLGDGNMHINIMTDGGFHEAKRAQVAVEEVFRAVLSLRGTLSGEHGIGTAKAPYLSWELSPQTLEAQRKVKAAFDPRGTLNPEKIWVHS